MLWGFLLYFMVNLNLFKMSGSFFLGSFSLIIFRYAVVPVSHKYTYDPAIYIISFEGLNECQSTKTFLYLYLFVNQFIDLFITET